ncbi:hypothetical protein [Planctomyces sp. SH-PL62]|uniref:hypothetical protein n=1 Tax=Planctomyces sp. SH-PL62 TaxID=1636152 RepID=UPI00078D0CEA|nr:hypothetical protein [Planctomyces sp. SH-PL62]AMV38562.1 hypothetical protein VT85_14085 [Planctomyces sp. SH-PL62]
MYISFRTAVARVLRRLRFRIGLTVRNLILAVAVVAVLFGVGVGLARRRNRLLEIALEHSGHAGMDGALILTEQGPAYIGMTTEKGKWHEAMRRKYDYYGRHPWLSMPEDPPEPE